jgi:hypothetical protein
MYSAFFIIYNSTNKSTNYNKHNKYITFCIFVIIFAYVGCIINNKKCVVKVKALSIIGHEVPEDEKKYSSTLS